MKVVQYSQYGHPPDTIEMVDTEMGAPGPGEVVVNVEEVAIFGESPDLVAEDVLTVKIASVYPLERAAETLAHGAMERF